MNPKIITMFIIFIIGIFFIFISCIFNNYERKFGYDIFFNLGFILIGFVVVDILWIFVRKIIFKFQEQKCGLVKIYKNPNTLTNRYLIDDIKKTKKNIDLMGYTLSYISLSDDIFINLQNKINSGIKVRIILPDPDNLIFNKKNNYKYLLHSEKTLYDLKTSIKIFKKFNGSNLKLKLIKNCPISFFIRRFDEKMYIIHYVWNIETYDSPVYEIKGENSILFQRYIKSFENLLLDENE